MNGDYHRELDSRHWQPTTARFMRNDLGIHKLIIHFWAKWDAYDRSMDANLLPSIERYDGRVEFRSLDIDIPQLQDVCRDAGIGNVPALAFYTRGHVNRILVGVRESQVIMDYIETWLAD